MNEYFEFLHNLLNKVDFSLDCGGGRRGHDDVTEDWQEWGCLLHHAGLPAHRVSELQNELRILGNLLTEGSSMNDVTKSLTSSPKTVVSFVDILLWMFKRWGKSGRGGYLYSISEKKYFQYKENLFYFGPPPPYCYYQGT